MISKKLALLSTLVSMFVLGMMFLGTPTTLAAGPWFVDPGGNDSNTCLGPGPANACLTINGAIAKASPGDTINVAAGTYPELVNVNKQLTLLGAQAGLDARSGRGGPESIVTGNAGTSAFFITASGVTVDGFTVQGQTNANQFGAGIVIGAGTSGAQIVNNIIQNNVVGLFLANQPAGNQAVIQGNLIRNNNNAGPAAGSGIYTDQYVSGGILRNVLIDNNKFSGNNDAGIDFSSSVANSQSNVTISNNEFAANTRAMVMFYLSSSQIIGNNIHDSTGASTADLRIFDGNTGLTINCNVIANGAGRGIKVSAGILGSDRSTNISAHNNNISGNAVAGLEVETASYTGTFNATNNWWGSATGPTIATNPGGTGDAIIDPDGVVTYVPFLTTLSICAPAPPKLAEVVVIGSTGTVDEADLAEYEVRNQFATIKDLVTGTVIYRYNLPAVANFQDGAAPKTFRIRYRDTGANQNVTVRLRAARLGADGVDTIYTFNSDSGSTGGGVAAANSNSNQTFDECSVTLPGDHILHGRYGYFLEVEITKSANDGTPSPGLIAFVVSDSGITDVTCP